MSQLQSEVKKNKLKASPDYFWHPIEICSLVLSQVWWIIAKYLARSSVYLFRVGMAWEQIVNRFPFSFPKGLSGSSHRDHILLIMRALSEAMSRDLLGEPQTGKCPWIVVRTMKRQLLHFFRVVDLLGDTSVDSFSLRKMLFVMSRTWDKEKIWTPMRSRTSGLPLTGLDTLPLSHRDSMVNSAIPRFIGDSRQAYCKDMHRTKCRLRKRRGWW